MEAGAREGSLSVVDSGLQGGEWGPFPLLTHFAQEVLSKGTVSGEAQECIGQYLFIVLGPAKLVFSKLKSQKSILVLVWLD